MKSLAACLAVLFIGSVLCRAQDESEAIPPGVITCGVGHNGQTAPLRSTAGFTVVLKMRSDDDHGLNSDLCMADYSLEITRPDGSSERFKFLASDDEWDRPLKFRVEGFSNEGSHALILLIEGNYPQSLLANDFDINSGHTVKSVLLDKPFSSRLGRDCAATLHIIGTSPDGYIVLGTEAKDGCTRVERWQLSHNKNLHRDIARSGPSEVANNHPAHLSPHTTVASLEPGVAVEPR